MGGRVLLGGRRGRGFNIGAEAEAMSYLLDWGLVD
jgi:hypothetical protein